MTNALATLTIVTVLEIVDTRDGELVADASGRERWIPIPGTGNAAECARCGRLHEVHATVELSDGTTRVMGTGCAKKVDATQASRINAGERRAKALAETRGLLAALRVKLAGIEARNAIARVEVAALEVPAVVAVSPKWAPAAHDNRTWWQCGDTTPFAAFPGDEARVQQSAANRWRETQLEARGWVCPRATTREIEAAETRLAKLEAVGA